MREQGFYLPVHTAQRVLYENKTAIAQATAVFCVVCGRKYKRGDLPQGLPPSWRLYKYFRRKIKRGIAPHRSPPSWRISPTRISTPWARGDPRGPQERSVSKWDDIKNAPRGKRALRCARARPNCMIDEGISIANYIQRTVPLSKNKPFLLPHIKNAAFAAS